MKANRRRIMQWGVIWLICIGLFSLQPAWAESNISTTYKYAWSENVGWQNWRATNAQATVETTYLEGYVWAENIGWIKLGSTPSSGSYANSSATNWGVNRNSSTGVLSGYAWSENVGWINFSPTNGGVTTNVSTGKFEGYAWGENIGWIHFQNASPEYYVQHAITPTPTPTPTPPTPNPEPAPCSLSIGPYNPSVTGNAGTATYDVSNATGYTNVSWTATVWQGGDWFTITSGATGTNSGTITCAFTANPSPLISRTAYIGIVPGDGLCEGHVGIMVTQNPLSTSATLLWTKTDGTAWVSDLDILGNLLSSRTYGPISGWTAQGFHKTNNSDGTAQMLWDHIAGTASVWFTNDMGDMGSMEYGPETGWSAVSYHLNSDGTAQMLWNHINGTASVWTLDNRGNITSRMLYGPYTDATGTLTWTAADYRRNSDGTANMLWVRTDAYTSVWTLDSSGNMTSRMHYGPYTDATDTHLWYARSYLRNADGTANMLWTREGYASVWTLNSSGNMTSRVHLGPYQGWTPRNYDKIN